MWFLLTNLAFALVASCAAASPKSNDGYISKDPFHKNAECAPLAPGNSPPSQYWLEGIEHNGQSSYLKGSLKASYTVFRHVVKDFGADNTGKTDATAAIQKAITNGAGNTDRASGTLGHTSQPAFVYLPSGTYLISKTLQLYVCTIIIGDPTNPPVLKAAATFTGNAMVNGRDPKHPSLGMFYAGMWNIVFDTTSVASSKGFAAVDWTVSQATQINNLRFQMPRGSNHTGVTCQNTFYSNLIVNDLVFEGGAYGINFPNGIQWAMKNITVRGTKVGIKTTGAHIIVQNSDFRDCTIAIDATAAQASFTVLDSTATNVDTFLLAADAKGVSTNNLILENIKNAGKTVVVGSSTVVQGNVVGQWSTGAQASYQNGKILSNPRPAPLLVNDKYFTMQQPTYEEYPLASFLNIKSVPDLAVHGDGTTDDTKNINAILQQYAGCKIIYFPAGTYIVSDTILIPPGSRITGDAWASTISAIGKTFADAKNLVAMVKVGERGSVGVAQISDLLLTTADILPGWRGALVEATQGTWMIGTSMEYHVLYHYNFQGAANVFTALQQTEMPYWQGVVPGTLAPWPWTQTR
ncbi:pectin lyase-like protein [Byssothecium circinans]|uniref:Pectin lyase-like protein n=1 Tax=Byssothecium circinans TaxID=147558 RepID=A0A6A5TD88_9PLEO|nr:pectin lyase-like protein [Byssothecium circinans]